MENKRVVPVWVSVVLLTICVITLIIQIKALVLSINPFNPYVFVNIVFYVLAILSAVFYCLYGYKKSAAKFFFLTTVFMLLTEFTAVIVNVSYTEVLPAVFGVVACCCLSVLSFSKDLGKTKSFAFSWIVACVYLLNTINFVINWGTAYLVTIAFNNLSIAVIFLLMVYAKYQDKAARGTK